MNKRLSVIREYVEQFLDESRAILTGRAAQIAASAARGQVGIVQPGSTEADLKKQKNREINLAVRRARQKGRVTGAGATEGQTGSRVRGGGLFAAGAQTSGAQLTVGTVGDEGLSPERQSGEGRAFRMGGQQLASHNLGAAHPRTRLGRIAKPVKIIKAR